MKTAISIPDELFAAAEALGKKLKLSRSRLYATALEEWVAKHRGRSVTDRLNRVYSDEDSRIDARLAQAQARVLDDEPW